jgi:hypothetical protein
MNDVSIAKFREILLAHGARLDGPETVAANTRTEGSYAKTTFYGLGEPIPSEVADAIRAEVFPLLDHAAEVSDVVLGVDGHLVADAAFREYVASSGC